MENYELMLVQIVVGILIGLVLIKLFQTKKSISYEKRIGKYAINSVKDNELSFFDQIHLFFYGLVKSFSKFLKRFRMMRKNSKKYLKYIKYSKKDEYDPIDFMSIKVLILLTSLCFCIIFSLAKYSNLNYYVIALSLLSFYILDIILKFEYENRKKIIEDDLLKAIMIMNNSFKSGKNIHQALEIVVKELNGPIQDEFKRILVDIRYGLSFDVAFSRFYKRVVIEDVKYITTSLILLNKTGGNIVNVFNNIEKSILNRRKMKDELNSLTSAAKLMYKILVILPILMVVIITLLNNNYFMPFFKHPFGILIFFLIIVLYFSYLYVIGRIMKVEIYEKR